VYKEDGHKVTTEENYPIPHRFITKLTNHD